MIELRTSLLLPIDDLLVVVRKFLYPKMSRSALDRCLRRHGISNLKDLISEKDGPEKPVKKFKDYEPGFIYADIKYLPKMPDEENQNIYSQMLTERHDGCILKCGPRKLPKKPGLS